jgi:hypothetical protein
MNVPSRHGIVFMQMHWLQKIANASPRIKQIFESWNTKDTAALLAISKRTRN